MQVQTCWGCATALSFQQVRDEFQMGKTVQSRALSRIDVQTLRRQHHQGSALVAEQYAITRCHFLITHGEGGATQTQP